MSIRPKNWSAVQRAIALGADPASFELGRVNEGLARFGGTLGPEAVEQAVTVAVLRSAGLSLVVSPAGVKMGKTQAAEAVVVGLEPGIPDLMIPTHLAAIEFKAPDRAPVRERTSPHQGARPEQRAWLHRLALAGWHTAVAFSAREAVDLLHGWGVLPGPAPVEPAAPTLTPPDVPMVGGTGATGGWGSR